MEQKQTSIKNNSYILVRPFEWGDWHAMWKLQGYHLAEHGVFFPDYVQGPPDFDLVYDESNPMYPEMDMERIDLAYLSGRGSFWIAWIDDQPLGMVGAQDMGDFIELRRMYVRDEYRRLGIGSLLVQTLIDHCKNQAVKTIKLWTAEGGPGRFLYQTLGFRQVALEGEELTSKPAMGGEIRMRLASTDQPGVLEVE